MCCMGCSTDLTMTYLLLSTNWVIGMSTVTRSGVRGRERGRGVLLGMTTLQLEGYTCRLSSQNRTLLQTSKVTSLIS
jgi:hypothetical protein